MDPRRRGRRRRLVPAAALATLAHLLAFLPLGWRAPTVAEKRQDDLFPPLQVTLVRPPKPARPLAPTPSASASRAPGRARPSPARPEQTAIPGPPAPVPAAPSAPALAEGPPDCALENLPLLTDAERARCRNQIEADKERRFARGTGERAAKQVAQAQRMPQTYRMDADKQAYYAAVADAYDQQTHGPPMAGHTPGVGCSVKFSGLKVAKSKPPPHSLSLGPCFLAPPQGFLTEELRIAPP
ncbi:MAG: hypothetical protein ACXWKY_18680 [Caulobacteraceae bacterium]